MDGSSGSRSCRPPRRVFFFFFRCSGHYTTPHHHTYTHWGGFGMCTSHLPTYHLPTYPPAGQDRMLNRTTIGEKKRSPRPWPTSPDPLFFLLRPGFVRAGTSIQKIGDRSRLVSGKGVLCLLTCLLVCWVVVDRGSGGTHHHHHQYLTVVCPTNQPANGTAHTYTIFNSTRLSFDLSTLY